MRAHYTWEDAGRPMATSHAGIDGTVSLHSSCFDDDYTIQFRPHNIPVIEKLLAELQAIKKAEDTEQPKEKPCPKN